MNRPRSLPGSLVLIAVVFLATEATAQKSGGVLRRANDESPPSASLHEEDSYIVTAPFVPVFNNLVVFDPTRSMSRPDAIVPDLATSWSWSADHKTLTFKLRRGVTWHDGKPFTAADVKCTWDAVAGNRDAGWRRNPRKAWYSNLKEIVVEGDDQVSFRLGRPQPSFLGFLAAGWSVVYPCHVDGRQMRQKPIGTGPFKVRFFVPGKIIRLVRNPDYFKPGRPYLDGIDMPVISSPGTRTRAFVAGDTDLYAPGTILLGEVKAKVPDAICEVGLSSFYTQLIINRSVAPLDDVRIRRALALAIDRNAVIQAQSAGLDRPGGELMPPPEGAWGLDKAELASIPGYGSDLEKRREAARKLMREAGYGPDKPLSLVLSAPDVEESRDAAAMILEDLSKIHVKGEMKTVDTAVWPGVLAKRGYAVAVRSRAQGMDDPDVSFYDSFSCDSRDNVDGYCNKEMQALFDRQSATIDQAARRRLVKEIDRKLQMDVVRPTIAFAARPYCRRPYVKGYVPSMNSAYANLRMEDVWLDK